MSIKVTVNLPDSTVEAMSTLADTRGSTKTEVIRQALENEKFFAEERRKGSKVLLEDSDGKLREVVFR